MKPSRTAAATLAALVMAAASWGAAAADGHGIWRCGNTYTDRPCEHGRLIGADDARDAIRKRDADDSARDARAAADRMERDRLRLEAAGARNRAVLLDDVRRPAADARIPGKARAKTHKARQEVLYADPQAAAEQKSKKKSKKKPSGE
jgi:CelD/BcsL family acetyltransferase involved in cellulose biosynthesis